MAKTLLDLAARIKKQKKELINLSSDVSKRVAFAIVKRLTISTPVDTSKALSNWQASIESPIQTTISPHFLGVKGSTKIASASKATGNAFRNISSKKPGQDIWIVNNTEYIVDLDNGSSEQSPGGFTDIAKIVARETLKANKR